MSTPEPAAETDLEPIPAPHVVVIGGGVAGLVAARDLAQAGVRVTLLEASDHLGGKVVPHTVGGLVLDAGAESYATREGSVAALATELGLGDAIVRPGSAGAWLSPTDAPPLPLPNAGLLGIPAVPLAADVIAVVGLAGALRAQLDSLMSGFVGAKERTLGGLVRKRMGRAVLDRLVTPVAGSIHSAHPDELEVDIVAPRLRSAMLSEGSLARAVLTIRTAAPAGSAVEGLEGGVFRLVEELAAALAGRADIRLSTPVADVADPAQVFADGAVHTADGERIEADHVVLAAPLGATPGVPIVIVTLVIEGGRAASELDLAPRGNGVLVALVDTGSTPPPRVQAKALTHATAKWDWLRVRAAGSHVIRLSYDAVPTAETELRELARHDASALLGVDIPSESVLGFARVDWTGPPGRGAAEDRATAPGVTVVGESVTGAGLAAIIGHSRAQTGSLLRSLRDETGLRWGPTEG